MRARFSVTMLALGFVTAASPVSAQYFDYTPRPADVEVDLSVLDDGRSPPTAPYGTAPGLGPISRKIETAPLPPLNLPGNNAEGFMPPVNEVPLRPVATPVATAPSPYERARTVERLEIEDPTPSRPVASPFSPPAVLAKPKPAVEAPRTAPAALVKPAPLSPLDGGDPVMVTGTENDDGVELPPVNVSRDVKADSPQIVKPVTAAAAPVALPVRKPETVISVRHPAPVAIIEEPPQPPAMPAGIRSSDSVIADLYELPPQEALDGADDLASLPLMADENVPPPPGPARQDADGTSAGLLIFDGSNTTLDDAIRDTLSSVAREMSKKDETRLIIRAYASGENNSNTTARSIALARAHAVRSYLMDEGLPAKRIDVRAMGRDEKISPQDRVDLVLTQ